MAARRREPVHNECDHPFVAAPTGAEPAAIVKPATATAIASTRLSLRMTQTTSPAERGQLGTTRAYARVVNPCETQIPKD